MRVTILGSDGSYPGPGGAASGYLVTVGTTRIWLDCGSGTLAALQTHIGIAEVDAIVVSHEHPDHRSDLEGFAVACTYVQPRVGVPVFAPAGVRASGYHTEGEALDWHIVGDGAEAAIGDVALRFARTEHPPETLAVRFDGGGRSFAFSGDTGPGWSLDRLGPPVDLALVEATVPAGHEMYGHLSGPQAGELARQGGARRLVVTHLQAVFDREEIRRQAEEAFGGPVELAEPGRTFEV